MQVTITITIPEDDRYYQQAVAEALRAHAEWLLQNAARKSGEHEVGDMKVAWNAVFE